ncbi:hypothetical protein IFM89_012036 [Coptis chinensis]|uniref:Uncharacterized protein n=1 Tax=Coptis chinensis TaxID=261450 RepID=A0A835IWC8_9MAGN|nr:hypothetical protein IFM89_012036 [Coptis chinensis]
MVYSATDEDSVTLITLIHSRKLKQSFDPSTKRKSHTDLNLEDYHPIDSVPSSKATIKPKPIAHGSLLMHYIPKPVPPTPPKHDGPPGGHY